jgi:hypothetical protein
MWVQVPPCPPKGKEMSRSYRQEKGPGYDFWSRRCFGCHNLTYGKIAKNITKKKERTRTKKMIRRIMNDPHDFDTRFSGE